MSIRRISKKDFQFVNEAYEVLSNLQERSWYDKNRANILGKESDLSKEIWSVVNLWKYFQCNSYENFDDSEKSFYKVYSQVFLQLDLEEIEKLGFSFSHQQVKDSASKDPRHTGITQYLFKR